MRHAILDMRAARTLWAGLAGTLLCTLPAAAQAQDSDDTMRELNTMTDRLLSQIEMSQVTLEANVLTFFNDLKSERLQREFAIAQGEFEREMSEHNQDMAQYDAEAAEFRRRQAEYEEQLRQAEADRQRYEAEMAEYRRQTSGDDDR